MNKRSKATVIATALFALAACATTKGAAVGAGIGAIAGDAGKGAEIGAAAGTVVGIID